MSATSFVELMSDPSFIEHEREEREREAREQHARRLKRGSHVEPSAGVKPSAADLRDSITSGRTFGFDHEMERQRRSSGGGKAPKQGERHGC